MPFTPFHFGLGVAAKAVAPRHISFQAFALTQVLMDIEPAVRMAAGQSDVHGWSHTWFGAVVVAALVLPVWRLIEGRRWYRWTVERVAPRIVAASAVLGALSHIAIDAMIHADMVTVRSFWDGSATPPWSHAQAEIACILAALLGGALLAARLGPSVVKQRMRHMAENLNTPPAFGRLVTDGSARPSRNPMCDEKKAP